MKIAFLHMTMGLTNRGSEGVVDSLAAELAKRHEVLVVQSGPVQKKPYRVKRVYPLSAAPAVAPSSLVDKLVFRLHVDAESGAVVAFTKQSLPTIESFDPDIVVAINGSLQLRILQGQALKAKLVVFGHAGIGYHDRDNLKGHPGLFVALTPSAYDWAKGLSSDKTKVVYIPNPVAKSTAKPIDTNLPTPVVLTVSALSKYKNVDKVVAAVHSLPASLLLIGDGEENECIETQLSAFPGDFRWIKRVEPSEMGSYYQSADVFCFAPDPQEAFGMVYLEAMAVGLPIVASDDPIRQSLIGEQGIYVDPHDLTSIRQGIVKAARLGRIDYHKQLLPYQLKTVMSQIEKEFHDLS
jgi:glycosyltransferase involved in cell wall biosynthesis